MKTRINLEGCDATTELELDTTKEQQEFLTLLVNASRIVREAEYGCYPILTFEEDEDERRG